MNASTVDPEIIPGELVKAKKPEIPNGIVTRILKLDDDLKSKKFRIQRDSVKTVNISMSLFIQLLTKTCEVVLSTSGSSIAGKRGENTLELEHLMKAVKRYDVLSFLKDTVSELQAHKPSPPERVPVSTTTKSVNRSKRPADRVDGPDSSQTEMDISESTKKLKTSQMSITSFFNKPSSS